MRLGGNAAFPQKIRFHPGVWCTWGPNIFRKTCTVQQWNTNKQITFMNPFQPVMKHSELFHQMQFQSAYTWENVRQYRETKCQHRSRPSHQSYRGIHRKTFHQSCWNMFFTSRLGRFMHCWYVAPLSGFLQANESDAAIHHHLLHIHIHWDLINTLLTGFQDKSRHQLRSGSCCEVMR